MTNDDGRLHTVSNLPPGYPFGPSPESHWPPAHTAGRHRGTAGRHGLRTAALRLRAAAAPRVAKPGIIPLRPLTLSEIFNGGVGYIRSNPKATLGLTATVVIAMQIITLIAFTGPLTVHGKFTTAGPTS